MNLQAKAILASDDTNCITDFLCKESRDRAIWLQENVEEKDRGPLYGIPISIKECFHVAGYDNTIGLVKYMNCPAKEDGAFVKVNLKEFHFVVLIHPVIPKDQSVLPFNDVMLFRH